MNVNSFQILVKPTEEPQYTDTYLYFKAEIVQPNPSRSNGPVGITVKADKYIFPKGEFKLPQSSIHIPTWAYIVTGDLYLDYSHIIDQGKVVRRGSDELTIIATSIIEVCQFPDWPNHPLANLIPGYNPEAYYNYAHSCTGNVGQVFPTDHENVENRSVALTRNTESDTKTPLWVSAAFWGDKSQLATNLIPARSRLSVSGPLWFKNWTDKPDGFSRVKVTVRVARFKAIPREEAA